MSDFKGKFLHCGETSGDVGTHSPDSPTYSSVYDVTAGLSTCSPKKRLAVQGEDAHHVHQRTSSNVDSSRPTHMSPPTDKSNSHNVTLAREGGPPRESAAFSHFKFLTKSHMDQQPRKKSDTRKCANCQTEEHDTWRLNNCAACQSVCYCGPNCQKMHWQVHKSECKRIKECHNEPKHNELKRQQHSSSSSSVCYKRAKVESAAVATASTASTAATAVTTTTSATSANLVTTNSLGPFNQGMSDDSKTDIILDAAAAKRQQGGGAGLARHWDFGLTINQFLKDIPEVVWDYHIVPFMGLKGLCCGVRTCTMLRDMWEYNIREKLIPLCVPADVATLCRAKEVIREMFNQRDSHLLPGEISDESGGDTESDDDDDDNDDIDGGHIESDTPPVDILLSEGTFDCDEYDIDVNGKKCATILLNFPIHIAGQGMGKTHIRGMVRVEGDATSQSGVVLRKLSIVGGSSEFGVKSVSGLPIKMDKCEVSDCNDAGLWIEKCGFAARPFELISCHIHHCRVGFATRKMSGNITDLNCHDNNYGLMVGTDSFIHLRGEHTMFCQNSEMNLVASGHQAAIAIHLHPSLRVTTRNERSFDMDSRKGGTIINVTTPRGQGILGQLYFKAQGLPRAQEKAKYWASLSAEQGFAESQYGLGQLYLLGKGVKKDYSKAKDWFERAMKQGHAAATRALALMFARGHGVPQSYVRANEVCTLAAAMGFAPAQCDLGFMYARGLGTEQSWERAKYWYELAAEQSHAAAYLNLGKMYFRGDGVKQSLDVALKYFQKVAESNDVKASQGMYNLAVMYQHGKGVAQSNERARSFLKQAADLGHKQAIEQLAEWNRLNDFSLKHFYENM